MKVLVSLHDVTPFHARRLAEAERLVEDLRVHSVAYLLVPRFHGAHDISRDAGFREWCRRPRPFAVEWLLHGLEHLERREGGLSRANMHEWMQRRWMTAGEGEFLALDAAAAAARLADGCRAFEECTGHVPEGFVPPAWLAGRGARRALADAEFRFTEDHQAVVDLRRRVRLPCPLITWATRTTARRVGSRIAAPLLLRHWRRAPAIRVAIHPHDLDHPATVDSITRVLRAALAERDVSSYAALLA